MYYNKTNMLIRNALSLKNWPLWKLSEVIGKSVSSVTLMMRQELPQEEQERIVALIEAAKDGE